MPPISSGAHFPSQAEWRLLRLVLDLRGCGRPRIEAAISVAQNWGTTNLFPMFGMPAFPVKRPIPIPTHNPFPLVRRPIPSHMLPQSGPRKQA
jgi:hypothetical protein